MPEDRIFLARGKYSLSIDLLARQTVDVVYLRRSNEGLDFLGVLCTGQEEEILLFFERICFHSLRKENSQILIAETFDGMQSAQGMPFFMSYVRTHPFCYLLISKENRIFSGEEQRHFYLVSLEDCFSDSADIPHPRSP